MTEIDELIQKALKPDLCEDKVIIRYAYVHTIEKWWTLSRTLYKAPRLNMVLLFVCGCRLTDKAITTHELPTVGDIAVDDKGRHVEILTVEWA